MEWHYINQNFDKIILTPKQVHVWVFNLDKICSSKNLFYSVLSEEELTRANHFRIEADKIRFICAKGILRYLIYIQTGIKPSLIKFSYNNYKKPELEEKQNKNSLKFNISNSKNVLCVGMVNNLDIGVDIEHVEPIPDMLGLSNKYFCKPELNQIKKLSGKSALETFYNFWTSKEAILKAVGKGLSLPLNKFEISITTNGEIRIINSKGIIKELLSKMYLEGFKVSKEIVGTLAITGKADRISYFKVEQYDDIIIKLGNVVNLIG